MNAEMILAVRPRHWRAIRDGRKTIELRRSSPARTPARIWLYVTQPYSRVMGVVDCAGVFPVAKSDLRPGADDPPNNAWSGRFYRDACVSSDEARAYLAGAARPTAFRIRGYQPCVRPLSDFGLTRPPQAWAWADMDAMRLRAWQAWAAGLSA